MPSIPFTGRQAELALLHEQFGLARDRGTRFLLVTAPAGMGKTALIRHFRHSLKDPCTWAAGRGWDNRAAVPYHALREALWQLPQTPALLAAEAEPSASYLTRFLHGEGQKEIGPLPPDLLFRRLSQFLAQCPQPLCLFLDDLQWADEGTFEWLDFALHELPHLPLFLLGACRSDARENIHRFLDRAEPWRRAGRFRECPLGPLSRGEVEDLVRQAVPAQHGPEELAVRIWQRSEGVALLAVEEIRAHLHGATNDASGPALIRHRFEHLPRSERELLDQAAVLGERFAVEPLAAALQREPLEIAQRLDELARTSGLLVAAEAGYGFAHSRYREALLEELSPPLRQLYHQRLTAQAVHLPPAEHTHHLVQAGQTAEGITALLQQGDQAQELLDWRDALRYYQEALWLSWTAPATPPPGRHEIYQRIGDLHFSVVAEPEIARGYYEAALAWAPSPRDTVLLLCRLVMTYQQTPRAVQYLEDAARRVAQTHDQPLQALVQFLQAERNPVPSPANQRRLYQLSGQLLKDQRLPSMLSTPIRWFHLETAGHFNDLAEIQRHARLLQELPSQSWTAARLHFDLAEAYHCIDRHLPKAIYHMEQAANLFRHLGRQAETDAASMALACFFLSQGNWAQARALMQEVLSHTGETQQYRIYERLCETWIHDHHPDGLRWAENLLKAWNVYLLQRRPHEDERLMEYPLQELGGAERICKEMGNQETFDAHLDTLVEELKRAGYRTEAIWYFQDPVRRPEVAPATDLEGWRWTADNEAGTCALQGERVTLTIVPYVGFIHLTVPRLLRQVAGDFVLQATIHSGAEVLNDILAGRQQAGAGHLTEQVAGGGGLLLVKDARNNLRLFAHVREPSEVLFEVRQHGQRRTLGRGLLEDRPIRLRLEKKNETLRAYAGNEDSSAWYRCGEIDLPGWEQVEIGIYGEFSTELYPLARQAKTCFWDIGLETSDSPAPALFRKDTLYLWPAFRPEPDFPEIVAESAPMKRILRQVRQVARSNQPVLLTGETGTGKELLARALHRLSPRALHPGQLRGDFLHLARQRTLRPCARRLHRGLRNPGRALRSGA